MNRNSLLSLGISMNTILIPRLQPIKSDSCAGVRREKNIRRLFGRIKIPACVSEGDYVTTDSVVDCNFKGPSGAREVQLCSEPLRGT